MVSSKEIGQLGEEAAKKHLQRIGYRIIDTNFSSRMGEIDIIAYDDTVLAFIEVKARKNTRYGTPGQAVDWKKQKKIYKAAMTYLSRNKLFYNQVRFDVIEIIIKENIIKQIRLIKDAFQPVGNV